MQQMRTRMEKSVKHAEEVSSLPVYSVECAPADAAVQALRAQMDFERQAQAGRRQNLSEVQVSQMEWSS